MCTEIYVSMKKKTMRKIELTCCTIRIASCECMQKKNTWNTSVSKCMCGVCVFVCVCVWEREREREKVCVSMCIVVFAVSRDTKNDHIKSISIASIGPRPEVRGTQWESNSVAIFNYLNERRYCFRTLQISDLSHNLAVNTFFIVYQDPVLPRLLTLKTENVFLSKSTVLSFMT